jgi:hypothetical protein
MSRVPIWFERKFEFSFRVELLPNLCARLRGTPARLEDVVRGRSHTILIGKTQAQWSAQENAGHLLDLEPLWLARVGDYVAASDQLTVADLKNRKTDEANHNSRPLEQILSEFRVARERLLKRLDELDASLFAPPAFEDADAARGPFVFCRRTRRSSSRTNMGTRQRRPVGANNLRVILVVKHEPMPELRMNLPERCLSSAHSQKIDRDSSLG